MILAWIISILAALTIGSIVGFKYRDLRDSILKLSREIRDKIDKKPEIEEQKSSLLDPYDVNHRVQAEHDEMMRKLNSK